MKYKVGRSLILFYIYQIRIFHNYMYFGTNKIWPSDGGHWNDWIFSSADPCIIYAIWQA